MSRGWGRVWGEAEQGQGSPEPPAPWCIGGSMTLCEVQKQAVMGGATLGLGLNLSGVPQGKGMGGPWQGEQRVGGGETPHHTLVLAIDPREGDS